MALCAAACLYIAFFILTFKCIQVFLQLSVIAQEGSRLLNFRGLQDRLLLTLCAKVLMEVAHLLLAVEIRTHCLIMQLLSRQYC